MTEAVRAIRRDERVARIFSQVSDLQSRLTAAQEQGQPQVVRRIIVEIDSLLEKFKSGEEESQEPRREQAAEVPAIQSGRRRARSQQLAKYINVKSTLDALESLYD